jgi:hypothetical protein
MSDRLRGTAEAPSDRALGRYVRYGVHLQGILLFVLLNLSCGSLRDISQAISNEICGCVALEPDATDYRHVAKHVPIPGGTPQEIDVTTILAWPQDLIPLPIGQPRTGRELHLVHVALAFLQNASINPGDCDIHMEISAVADKQAPRVVVETPVDSEYCSARQSLQSQLKKHGFQLDVQHGGELAQSLRISLLGLPFEDFEHGRGSAQVSTLWEIHPAQVTIM